MDEKHRNILRTSFVDLTKNIHNVMQICDHLLSAGVLDSGMVDEIKFKSPAPTAQVRELLSILPRRGKRAYECFINALIDTENKDSADILKSKEDPIHTPTSNKSQPMDTQESKISYSGKEDISNKLIANPPAKEEWPDLEKGCTLVQKKEFVKRSAKDLEKIVGTKTVYHLTERKKGQVIVISNAKCAQESTTNSNEPKGTSIGVEGQCIQSIDFDKSNIQLLFQHMKFELLPSWTNITKEEMKNKLRNAVEENGSRDFDSLVVVILSGGHTYEPDQIYDKNGDKVDRGEILQILRESSVFKGKPKVVIFATYNFEEKNDAPDTLDAAVCKLQLPPFNNDDLFVVTAVPKIKQGPWILGPAGTSGSYFIQALAHVFTQKAYTKSFLDLMEEVNNCLHTAMVPKSKNDKIGKRTVVAEVLILEFSSNKKLYLFPSEVIEFWPNVKKRCEMVQKKHIKMSTDDILKEMSASKKVYHMTGTKKGKVIIISNVKSGPDAGKSGNCGSSCGETQSKSSDVEAQTNPKNDIFIHCKDSLDFDITNIQQLLKYMKFESPNPWKDIDKKEIKERLLALEKDGATFNSLVLVILSGGQFDDAQQIYDTNGEKVEREEILQILRESSAFKGKPKVVIFTTYNFKENNTEKVPFSQDAAKFSISIPPNNDDLFVVTAVQKTKNGPWIIGDNMSGSYFIQALVHVFKQHAHDTSFLDLMEEVNYSLQTALVPTPLPTPLEGRKFSDDGKPTPVAEVVLLELATEKALYLFPGLDNISSKTEESKTLKSESGNPVTPVVGHHVTCTENHPVGESTPNVTETAKDSDEPTSGKSVE